MAYGEEEDSFPTKAAPKGILSSLPTVGTVDVPEQMAPEDDDEHSDAETAHADQILAAIKSGDGAELRDSLKALIMECIRSYGSKGKSPL